jgi:hypothetical protein
MKKLLMAIILLVISVNVYAQTAGTVTFYAYGRGAETANGKSSFGHVFVTVSTDSGYEETVGFYGSDSIIPFGPGRLLDDEANIDYAKTSYPVRITSNQLNRVKAIIADWGRNPRKYGWKDCVGFAEEIAKACGLQHKDWRTQLPMTFIEDLYELNGSGW